MCSQMSVLATHLLAELGVVFLLFDIGLLLAAAHLGRAPHILGLGPLQIVLCGLAFGAIAAAFGFGAHAAIILGGTLALSSTAVVVQTLAERGQQNCPVGLTGTAVLIFQDICAIFLLILAASLEGAGAAPAGVGPRDRGVIGGAQGRGRVSGGGADRALCDQAAVPISSRSRARRRSSPQPRS